MISSAVLFVLAIYVVVLVTPGPNLVVVVDLAARGESAAAVATGIGFGVGATVLAIATVSGLASLVLVAPMLKTVLTVVAACMLVWFGVSALRTAGRAAETNLEAARSADLPLAPPGPALRLRAFAKGFAFNLTNPKALAFFVGVYGGPMIQEPLGVLVAVLCVCLALEIGWYVAVTRLFSTAPVRRVYARHQTLIGRTAGVFLIAFGAGVAAYAAEPALPAGGS